MAKTHSKGLVGKQLDGIWHTAISVYGKEYHFGAGISTTPLSAKYGEAAEIHNMGSTEITQRQFEDFLESRRSKYMEKYHMVQNNCNHFTNECSQFLLGKDIPFHISGLPEEVLATPFGSTVLAPLIEQFFNAQGWKPISDKNPVQDNQLFSAILDLFDEVGEGSSMFGFYPS
eukprot:Phypoly_transcript_17225.p1 GENE.Phypoly_transcript_17225~~Phypoly_transcript_17225.p1  ORF type:complete len:199 (+),score=34.57 Phypoly_transcript_17225:80-598(+)